MVDTSDVITLTDEDRQLVAGARRAFAIDPAYLIRVLDTAHGMPVLLARSRARMARKEALSAPSGPSLEDLLVLRRVERTVAYIDGCWCWCGALANGTPALKIAGMAVPVRRWLWARDHGRARYRIKASTTCRPLCVNPDHLRQTSGSEVGRRRRR